MPLLDLAKRLLANVDAERGDLTADMVNVPVSAYTDQERYEREVERIFHRSPLLVALSCDVGLPGDFTSLVVAGRPVLVVRGDDGRVRSFLNICRHRGAPVTEECFGHGRRWLGDMASALEMIRLDQLVRHRDGAPAESGN